MPIYLSIHNPNASISSLLLLCFHNIFMYPNYIFPVPSWSQFQSKISHQETLDLRSHKKCNLKNLSRDFCFIFSVLYPKVSRLQTKNKTKLESGNKLFTSLLDFIY